MKGKQAWLMQNFANEIIKFSPEVSCFVYESWTCFVCMVVLSSIVVFDKFTDGGLTSMPK